MNLLETILTQTLLSNNGIPKQQKILEAAIKLFAEKGYSNTSTKEISVQAGVAEGTLFRYYKTKETLLLALITPFVKNIVPKISEDLLNVMRGQSFDHFEDFLRFIIKDRIDFIKDCKQLFQIFIKEVLYRDDFREKWMPAFNPLLLNYFNDILNYFKGKGEIKDLPNVIIFRTLANLLGGYFISRFLLLSDGIFKSDEEETEILVGFIMGGLKN